jgi:hypothetical protein
MFQFAMTQFEHISFKKRMLKPTYIFIRQHNFIDFENNIFLSTIHINHANGLKEFQVKLNVPFSCVNLLRKFYIQWTI